MMKKFVPILVVLAGSLLASDHSGIWYGKGGYEDPKYGTVPEVATITLLQAGSTIKGTLRIGGQNAKILTITSGTVNGATITFAVGSDQTGTLTEDGAQLKGRLTSSTGRVLDLVFNKR